MGNLSDARHPCTDRPELEGTVVAAVRVLYDAKPEDRDLLFSIERAAVKALQQHIEEHSCGPVTSSGLSASPKSAK